MRVDEDLISYLEELSCLTLSEDEKRRLTVDLDVILGYMARLSAFDTMDIPAHAPNYADVSALREDASKPSMDTELLLKNAPNSANGMLVAPKTV